MTCWWSGPIIFGDKNFDSRPWRFCSSMGLPEKFRISVVRTFGTGFDILGAEKIRPGFCLSCRVRLIGGTVECFGRFVVRIDWKIVSDILP